MPSARCGSSFGRVMQPLLLALSDAVLLFVLDVIDAGWQYDY
jgi:hypothetical protein